MRKRILYIAVPVALLLSLTVVAYAEGGLFSWIGDIANFIKRLFVPDPNYFHNKLAELSEHANDRLGGIAYLYHMLESFFRSLNYVSSAGFSIRIPDNYFFRGYQGINLDFLTLAKPYIGLLRNVLTSAFCLFIGVCCYHKIRSFFKE